MHIIPPTSQSFKIKYIKEVGIFYFYIILMKHIVLCNGKPLYDL